jgi:hypothetical protein
VFENFMTRNYCGHWSEGLIAVNQISNALIALSYFAIPLTLLGAYWRLRRLRVFSNYHPWPILMFVLFIILCGTTHLCNVIAFHWAPYKLFTLIDSLTAVASVITSVVLPKAVYDIFNKIEEDCNG